MLSRIKEERLPVIAAPVDSRAFSDELNSARSHVLDLISRHLTEFGDKFPAETCQNGFYPLTDNVEWTTSFWTGQLWLAWEMSGEEKFRAMAEKHVRSFGLRIAGRNDTNTHDLGFLYTLSCVAAWRAASRCWRRKPCLNASTRRRKSSRRGAISPIRSRPGG